MTKIEKITVCVLISLIVLIVTTEYRAQKEWQAFKLQHDCKIVAKESDTTFTTTGFSTSGNMNIGVGTLAGKTSWLCNDGITYIR